MMQAFVMFHLVFQTMARLKVYIAPAGQTEKYLDDTQLAVLIDDAASTLDRMIWHFHYLHLPLRQNPEKLHVLFVWIRTI